ncbi:hypothetical protein V6N13_062564 [Hibiscus sabdariffa]
MWYDDDPFDDINTRFPGSSCAYTFYFDHKLSLFKHVEAKVVPFYIQIILSHSMNTYGGTSTGSGWMQQTCAEEVPLPASSLGFPDATIVTSSDSFHSPNGSSSKPIRRRPRVSKKKPTTLVNANASNFRALVQRFTGCPVSANTRGPVNLNFALGTEHNQRGTTATSTMLAAGSDNHFYYHQETASQQEQQHHPDALFSSSNTRARLASTVNDVGNKINNDNGSRKHHSTNAKLPP